MLTGVLRERDREGSAAHRQERPRHHAAVGELLFLHRLRFRRRPSRALNGHVGLHGHSATWAEPVGPSRVLQLARGAVRGLRGRRQVVRGIEHGRSRGRTDVIADDSTRERMEASANELFAPQLPAPAPSAARRSRPRAADILHQEDPVRREAPPDCAERGGGIGVRPKRTPLPLERTAGSVTPGVVAGCLQRGLQQSSRPGFAELGEILPCGDRGSGARRASPRGCRDQQRRCVPDERIRSCGRAGHRVRACDIARLRDGRGSCAPVEYVRNDPARVDPVAAGAEQAREGHPDADTRDVVRGSDDAFAGGLGSQHGAPPLILHGRSRSLRHACRVPVHEHGESRLLEAGGAWRRDVRAVRLGGTCVRKRRDRPPARKESTRSRTPSTVPTAASRRSRMTSAAAAPTERASSRTRRAAAGCRFQGRR